MSKQLTTAMERLRHHLLTLPRAERAVARALLANYPAAGLQTIAKLAAEAGASGPTVLRLAERLGYTSYSDFQEALRDELTERTQSPLGQFEERGDGEGAYLRARRAFTAAIERTFELTDPADFELALNLLAHAKRGVYTTGGRFSSLVAQSLALHLEIARAGVRYLDPSGRNSALMDLGRHDVLFIADLRRYQETTIRFGRDAARRGTRLILLTDQWQSPLTPHAEVVLRVALDTPSPFDSLVPAEAMVEALVAGVVDVLGEAPRERMRRYDASWSTSEAAIDEGLAH